MESKPDGHASNYWKHTRPQPDGHGTSACWSQPGSEREENRAATYWGCPVGRNMSERSEPEMAHGYYDRRANDHRRNKEKRMNRMAETVGEPGPGEKRRRGKSEDFRGQSGLYRAAGATSYDGDNERQDEDYPRRARARSMGYTGTQNTRTYYSSQTPLSESEHREQEARRAAAEETARHEAEEASKKAASPVTNVIDLCEEEETKAAKDDAIPPPSSFTIPEAYICEEGSGSSPPPTSLVAPATSNKDDSPDLEKAVIVRKKNLNASEADQEYEPDHLSEGELEEPTPIQPVERRRSTRRDASQGEATMVLDDFVDGDEKSKYKRLTVEKETDHDVPSEDPETVYFQYPRKDPEGKSKGAIVVTAGDFARLRPNQYLNDTIIDLFFKEYQDLAESRRPKEMHFFSSFFYRRLVASTTNIDYEGVRSWTKDIDLFSKKIVLIPICDLSHWSLAVVVNPGSLQTWKRGDRIENSPALVYFDSLSSLHKKSHLRYIKEYLTAEWKHRKPGQGTLNLRSLREYNPRVPKQSNDYDCGLYCLMYARRCISDLHVAAGKALDFCHEWFTEFDVWAERQVIRADLEHRRDYEMQLMLIPDARETLEGSPGDGIK